MERALLPHIPAVLAVARAKSFARGAADLGIGASAVSHAVKSAEQLVGTPLFARTTRSVSLTEAGAIFVEAAERAFEEIESATERVRADQRDITGVLRVNAPRVALSMGLVPILCEMSQRHPGLTVEIVTDDALTDVVADGFDAGIRLGEMIAQDMVAVRMTPPFRAIMVASPGYLGVRGIPKDLSDLPAHNCIGFRLLASGAVYEWDLAQDGRDVSLPVQGSVRVTDPTFAKDLAVAGVGIAYIFEPLVRAELEHGSLVEVLPEAAIQEPGLFLYFPRRATGARKLAALVEVVRNNFRQVR